MKRANFARTRPTAEFLLFIAAFCAFCVFPASADRKSDAREQFMRAIKLRTALEAQPQKDRSLSDYKQTIAAYHKVYLVSTQAEEVTPSLIAEGELYQQMGALFDPKYFDSAVERYRFLLKQYPGSRYRADALYAIGLIQKIDLKQPDAAEVTLKEFLNRFPRSEKAAAAREELKQIAQDREDARQREAAAKSAAAAAAAQQSAAAPQAVAEKLAYDSVFPALKGEEIEPQEAGGRVPHVTAIRSWNADNQARVVLTLEGSVKYDAARISNPDRIYFDIHKAQVEPKLTAKAVQLDSGLLKSVRIAQNRQGVVRLVLDASGAKQFSASLLTKPYRLVIEIYEQPLAVAKSAVPPAAAPKLDPPKSNPSNPDAAPGSPSAVVETTSKPSGKPAGKLVAENSRPAGKKTTLLVPPPEPKPTRDGQRSLTRALGLKISRIVIDPGHGGHDTGTIGPHGLMEKDLCLDIGLRLGRLIEDKIPGAEVVYTRKDDTFIPLEDRTAVANNAKADLFISIHANSSHDHATRGIETYYLNFAASAESMEVAARENALSQESLHDLQDLIKKIARNEKIEESKELATDIQDSLSERLQLVSQTQKNRGVKKAPFIVLIGANMPSVLTEISFLSNPNDERLLRKSEQRQRVADGLYRGIASYLENLNSLSYQRLNVGSDSGSATVASTGNPK